VAPITREKHFDDECEVIAFIVSSNIHRRHLDQGQRAMLGEELRQLLAAAAREKQRAAGKETASIGGKGTARHQYQRFTRIRTKR
jgi:hypothetical protein